MHVLGKRKAENSRRVNPLCLMLSPTRELAQQVCDFKMAECSLSFDKELCHIEIVCIIIISYWNVDRLQMFFAMLGNLVALKLLASMEEPQKDLN